MTRLGLILLTASTLAWLPAWAEKAPTYRWVDEKGKVHYGDSIPSGQADLGHSELDSLGHTIRIIDRTRLSPTERQQRAEEEFRRQAEKRREAEEHRHDNALISTYASADEIDLARDRAIALENKQLNGLQSLLNSALDKYSTANKKITQSEILDQIPPAGLVQVRKEAGSDITLYKALIEQRERIIAELNGRFDADKKRYIELKERLRR